MKRSRLLLVSLSGAFTLAGLGLMVVSADDKELSRDLTNAIQHVDEIKFTHTGSNPEDATMKRVTNKEVIGIKAKNFNITQKGTNYNSIGASVRASSILGGSKNKISQGRYNVIIAGSDNSIECGEGVTVLGGENNKAGGNYTTILGGKDNNVNGCNNSSSSVIVGGSNNGINGQNSVVVGMNNSVTGSSSVAMGKNSKVKASNSFLWTDGNQNGQLDAGNVFAVVSDNGMVVNTNEAHSFAKLTIGGGLILYGDDRGNFSGLGGGKIKVVNGDSNNKCFCSYDGDKWNSLFGKGRCNYYCNQSLASLEEPKCGEEIHKKCGAVQYTYTGSCEKGKLVEGTGAYILDKNNKAHWSCQTDDGKVVNCEGEVIVDGTCGETNKCGGTLPKNAVLNNPIAVADGGTYHYAATTDQSACAYHCKENYHLNGTNCSPDVKENVDCINLPTNAKWVNGKFKQKWNGNFWYPIVKQATYKPASQGGASIECSYECKENYNRDGVRCVANRKTINCTGNPANSTWVSGTFQQVWDGSSWKPTLPGAKHISNNSIDCYYRCDSSHVRNGSDCSCPATAGFGQSCCKETTCTASTESGAPSRFCSNSNKCEECTNYGGECKRAGGDLGVCVLVNGAGECQVGGGPTPGPTPDPSCNIATAGNGESCCATSHGDLMDTVCRPDKKENNDYHCLSHKICEECDNYGKRCSRPYYTEGGYGQGICVKRNPDPKYNGTFFGECVACFGDNQTYDLETGKCSYVQCGTTAGSCSYCKIDGETGKIDCENFNASVSNGSWTCSRGDENINGVSKVSCGMPVPELDADVSYTWINWYQRGDGNIEYVPQSHVNLVIELVITKNGKLMGADDVIGKYGDKDIRVRDLDRSRPISNSADKFTYHRGEYVPFYGVGVLWVSGIDGEYVKWKDVMDVSFKGKYNGNTLIEPSIGVYVYKDACQTVYPGTQAGDMIDGNWFNRSSAQYPPHGC